MKKGIFLTHEGIADTIFDSQVAMHVKEMKVRGIEMEIITYETWPKQFHRSSARVEYANKLSNSKVRLKWGFFIYLPFSELLNSLLFFIHFSQIKPRPQFVHARTDYSAAVAAFTTFFYRKELIWDCRGNGFAEFKDAISQKSAITKMVMSYYLICIKIQTYVATKFCSKAIFVSQTLREVICSRGFSKTYIIVPTTASILNFYFDQNLRNTVRKKYNLPENKVILLYSGGLVSYQGFDKYVDLFNKLSNWDEKYFFLVLTPHTERAIEYLKCVDQKLYRVLTAKYNEMNGFYNAADFGILIRDNNKINSVASPTKFSEYCLSGLPIIMNNSVIQSYKYAKEIGNLVELDSVGYNNELVKLELTDRDMISLRSKEILSRELFLEKYISIYLG